MNRFALLLVTLLAALGCLAPTSARADGSPDEALALLGRSDHGSVARGITLLPAANEDLGLRVLAALEEGRLRRDSEGRLFLKDSEDGPLLAVPALTEGKPSGELAEVPLNNSSRRALGEALSRLRLTADDVTIRRAAAAKLAEYPDPSGIELIRGLLGKETDEQAHRSMALAVAKVDLTSESRERRLAAARAIIDSDDISLVDQLTELTGRDASGKYRESDGVVRAQFAQALSSEQNRLFVINTVSNVLYGLSLGSVLMLAALGLAITFGLMRVINMAHGEMLMLGAYSTYFVREVLIDSSPALVEWYLLFAVPFAFATTFLMGVLLERLVIRHLYGRPLETLLATWGLSLILIQLVRTIFGAQNVTVANPDWLSGGVELMPALVVPYSRIFVLVFSASAFLFVRYILRGTSLGLQVRAVTQNRSTAAALGIRTHHVDMWTFGLGSGLAGLGGVALSQLGNVGPELGQQHIIDSFMVVVLGGVGNILGTICAGFGLGIANKLLEPSVGAVLGKIVLLGMLILFIQWRPQGLFAQKGRAAEA